MANVVYAVESVSVVVDGGRTRVARDQAFFEDDAVVQAHPDLFTDVPEALRLRVAADENRRARAERIAAEAEAAEKAAAADAKAKAEAQVEVEDATAEPGKKRAVKKRAAASK